MELKSKMAESLPRGDMEQRPASVRRDSNLLRPHGQEGSPRAASLAGDVKESLLQCSVCLEPFHIPKALPCLHIFCLGCLENIESSAVAKDPGTKGKIQCPQCRAVSTLPEDGPQGLPTSHTINSLSDLTEKHRKKSSNQQMECSVCSAAGTGEVLASRFCFTCGSARCEECAKKHDLNAIHENHVSVDITEEKVNSLLCPDHAGQCVTCFCTTCSKPICTLCLHKDHSEHSHAPFMVRTGTTEKILSETMDVIRRCRTALDAQKCRYQEHRTLNDEIFETFKSAVERHTEDQIRLLRQQKDDLLNKSRHLHSETDNQITSKTNLLEKIVQSLTGEEEQTNHISCPLNGHNTVVVDMPVPLKRATLLNKQVKNLPRDSSVTTQGYTFAPGPEVFLGTLYSKVDRSSMSQSDTSSLNEATNETSDESEEDTLRTAKWSEHEGMENVSDVCVYNDNEVLCVSGFWPEKSIFRLDKHGVKKQLPSSLAKYSQGILKLATNTGYLAILKKSASEEFAVTVLSAKDDSLLSVLKKQSHIATFSCTGNCQPRAITVTRTGEVVMATVDKHLLRCYSPKGEIFWERDVSPQIHVEQGGIQNPVTMATDSYSRVLVVDMDAHQINVYTGILFNFSFPSPRDVNMKPVAVCQADDDNFFVAFIEPDCVINLYDKKGQLIKRVVKLQHPPTKVQYMVKHSLLLVGTLGFGVIAYKLNM